MPRRSAAPAVALAACFALACASGGSAPRTTNARLLAAEKPVSCSEWVARAKAKPELDVERVPEPVAYNPAPLPRRAPPGAMKNGKAEVRIKVLVDTLGRADMKTFKVVRSTHPQLTASVRTAVSKWKFTPAMVGGCKVPRIYNWGAVAGG